VFHDGRESLFHNRRTRSRFESEVSSYFLDSLALCRSPAIATNSRLPHSRTNAAAAVVAESVAVADLDPVPVYTCRTCLLRPATP